MKTLLLAATLFTTLSAQASFMSKRCSNADSTIITQSGHGANSITVHEYSQVVSSEKLPVKLDMRDINITSSEEKTLFSKTTNGCVEGERFGFGSSDSISAKKITITNKDGSAFPSNTIGTTIDNLKIEDYVICESNISWQQLCEVN